MSYEWRRQAVTTPTEAYHTGKTVLAEAIEVDRLIDHVTTELNDTGFFFPENKRSSMMTNLANIFRRAPLTDQDVRTLRGVVRALSGKRWI